MKDVPDYSAFAADAPDTGRLSQLGELAERLEAARAAVAAKEAELAEAQAAEKALSEVDIPQLMSAMRIAEVKLQSGAKLSVGTALRTSISAERRGEAHAWLKEKGLGALIKRTVVAAFGRGEEGRASALVADLLKSGVSAKSEEKVEPATLKKVIGDMLKGGAAVPMDLFGAHVQAFTKIEQPKGE